MSFITIPESKIFVLSGPSGSGKTSLALALSERNDHITYVRSCTTRKPREGLTVETHYDYITKEEFLKKLNNNEFVEWVCPEYGEYYGTPREPVEAALSQKKDVLVDYCTEGYLNMCYLYPDQVVGIFVIPASFEALKKRLIDRNTETSEEQKIRFEMALKDFNFVGSHKYHVVNDDFDSALQKIQSICIAEKCTLDCQQSILREYNKLAADFQLRYY